MSHASQYTHASKKKATPVSSAERRAELWVDENVKAFETWNTYVEKNGLPLIKYRRF